MFKKKKGFIDISLIFIISMFLLLVVFIGILEYMQPVVKYINLNQICRKYILKMEKDGGLSPSNLTNMQNDLKNSGYTLSDIKITATATGTVEYGDDVTLEVTYNCKYRIRKIDGLMITTSTDIIPMHISKSTTSKKG